MLCYIVNSLCLWILCNSKLLHCGIDKLHSSLKASGALDLNEHRNGLKHLCIDGFLEVFCFVKLFGIEGTVKANALASYLHSEKLISTFFKCLISPAHSRLYSLEREGVVFELAVVILNCFGVCLNDVGSEASSALNS